MARMTRRGFDQKSADPATGSALAKRLIIEGTVNNDTLVGTIANEVFKPLTGADIIKGGGGIDCLVVDYSEGKRVFGISQQVIKFDINGHLYGLISGAESSTSFSDISKLRVQLSRGDGNVIISAPTQLLESVHIQITANEKSHYSLSLDFRQSNSVSVYTLDDGTVVSPLGEFSNFYNVAVAGSQYNDSISISNGTAHGGSGNDRLAGSNNDEFLFGDLGTDVIEGKGGEDTFGYLELRSSSDRYGIDTIVDFNHTDLDHIYFAGSIDANQIISGNQRFIFIGDAEISGAGQLRSVSIGAGMYQVQGNTDNDADLEFVLTVFADLPLVESDFIL